MHNLHCPFIAPLVSNWVSVLLGDLGKKEK